jgi:hypothetical protein
MKHDEDSVAGCLTFVTVIIALAFIAAMVFGAGQVDGEAAETYVQIETPVEESAVVSVESKAVDPEEVFVEPEPYYPLSEEERDSLAVVLMCETGGADEMAAELVATCVLNACEKDGLRPFEVFSRYKYAVKEKTPNSVCYAAVQSVFDEGNRASEECILWFYSPANMTDGVSHWHETQDFVLEYGGHRYFKAKEK